MASRRLELAETKALIYQRGCREAHDSLVAGHSQPLYLIQQAVKILHEADAAAIREGAWVELKSLPSGALFEVKAGLRFVKTSDSSVETAICIPLDTGASSQLWTGIPVRLLAIKEG